MISFESPEYQSALKALSGLPSWKMHYESSDMEDDYDGTPLRAIRDVMDLDVEIRAAEASGVESKDLCEKRLAALELLSREAVALLASSYEKADGELFPERDFYARQLELKDRTIVKGVSLSFERHDENGASKGDCWIKLDFWRNRITVLDHKMARVGTVLGGSEKSDFEMVEEDEWGKIAEEVRLCNFPSWRRNYGNCEGESPDSADSWWMRVSVGIKEKWDGSVLCQQRFSSGCKGFRPAEWHHVERLVIRLLEHVSPEERRMFEHEVGSVSLHGYVDVDQDTVRRLACHRAFACQVLGDAPFPREKGYTVVSLKSEYGGDVCTQPSFDMPRWENEFVGVSVGEAPLGLSVRLHEHADGFAIFQGRTLAFVYLGGDRAMARRMLPLVPEINVGGAEGVHIGKRAARAKISLLLIGLAVFFDHDEYPPRPYFGHQEGVFPECGVKLGRKGELDHMWVACNSDRFVPRFAQDEF